LETQASIVVIGYMAAICTTISLLPQVYKTYTTQSSKDLSLGTFFILASGLLLWTIYGYLNNDYPIIIANVFSLTLAMIMIFFKFYYRKK
jgi:MtN3 and saliva related transmembrane protein